MQESSPVADAIELSELSEAESEQSKPAAHKEDVLYVKWRVCEQSID